MIHKLTLSIRSIRYACALKPLRSCHHLLSPFICQASDIYLLNVPATYYRCLFFSISFSKIFDSFFFGAEDDANPENLVVRCVVFAYALCSKVRGIRPTVPTGDRTPISGIYEWTFLLTEPIFVFFLVGYREFKFVEMKGQ